MDLLAEIQAKVRKQMDEQVATKIKELKKNGPIPKIREFELVFQNIITGFGIPPQVDDTMLDNPKLVKSLQDFVKGNVHGTSLNSNEYELFDKFVDNLSKDQDIVIKYKELLDEAHKEEPLYLYNTVNSVLTQLLAAREGA